MSNLEHLMQNGYATEAYSWYIPEFSVLWRPFVVLKELDSAHLAIMITFTLAFFYLVTPLLIRIGRVLCIQAREIWQSHWVSNKWRF